MRQIKLSKRLFAAASFVRNGSVVADVGTDHAYIPIYLVTNRISPLAIATDINEGPIFRARQNILLYGVENKVVCYCASGLEGIEEHSPDDVLICGMGGELVARILEESQYVKNTSINLILQPMTSIFELRSYLRDGFLITDESIVFEDGKYYQIICARYDGQVHKYTDLELEIGKINIQKKEKIFFEYVNHIISKKKKILQGLIAGKCDTSQILKEIAELEGLK